MISAHGKLTPPELVHVLNVRIRYRQNPALTFLRTIQTSLSSGAESDNADSSIHEQTSSSETPTSESPHAAAGGGGGKLLFKIKKVGGRSSCFSKLQKHVDEMDRLLKLIKEHRAKMAAVFHPANYGSFLQAAAAGTADDIVESCTTARRATICVHSLYVVVKHYSEKCVKSTGSRTNISGRKKELLRRAVNVLTEAKQVLPQIESFGNGQPKLDSMAKPAPAPGHGSANVVALPNGETAPASASAVATRVEETEGNLAPAGTPPQSSPPTYEPVDGLTGQSVPSAGSADVNGERLGAEGRSADSGEGPAPAMAELQRFQQEQAQQNPEGPVTSPESGFAAVHPDDLERPAPEHELPRGRITDAAAVLPDDGGRVTLELEVHGGQKPDSAAVFPDDLERFTSRPALQGGRETDRAAVFPDDLERFTSELELHSGPKTDPGFPGQPPSETDAHKTPSEDSERAARVQALHSAQLESRSPRAPLLSVAQEDDLPPFLIDPPVTPPANAEYAQQNQTMGNQHARDSGEVSSPSMVFGQDQLPPATDNPNHGARFYHAQQPPSGRPNEETRDLIQCGVRWPNTVRLGRSRHPPGRHRQLRSTRKADTS
ncbi:unnamed protein product [Rangifer tarandus platyrhynchus]|uniref:Uncharacterized protein n=1 Tax=Rangifer tarandus platyrhynchus TaxID=3082113 RepID=A0ABN8XNP2_RANTA|nr:unnamed protein product [Rangifer tarandus platyrhynchus]